MSRHIQGSGTVYLRGKIWWISYYVHGVPVQRSSKSSDRTEAERQLKVAVGEVAAGELVTPDKATIDDLCALVISDYKIRRLRDLKTVEWRYKAHIKKLLGSQKAARFGIHQVRAYIETRRRDEASDATINRELAIIRRGFTLGRQEDPPLIRRMPHIPSLEEDNARQGFIEEAQYERLRASGARSHDSGYSGATRTLERGRDDGRLHARFAGRRARERGGVGAVLRDWEKR